MSPSTLQGFQQYTTMPPVPPVLLGQTNQHPTCHTPRHFTHSATLKAKTSAHQQTSTSSWLTPAVGQAFAAPWHLGTVQSFRQTYQTKQVRESIVIHLLHACKPLDLLIIWWMLVVVFIGNTYGAWLWSPSCGPTGLHSLSQFVST